MELLLPVEYANREILPYLYICDVVVLCAVMRCGAKCAELNIWVKGFAFKHVERTRSICNMA